jgi:uncharacterized sporulation protein YeaH/YhbH (DUF444 family)
MSARPELIRPAAQRNTSHSARAPSDQGLYSARNQFAVIKNSREGLTTDDIVNLKREKQNLIQERSILKAKLARYANFNRHTKPPGRNQQIVNSLERQVHTLEQLTAAKRAEIAKLIYSDRAAVVTELQEESKMLHLELMRLKKTKQDTENDLREISLQLQEAQKKYSPSVLNKQHKQIRALERQIAAQRTRNEKIKEKISQMKKEQEAQNYEEQNDRLQKEIEGLKGKIRNEQQQIAALDKQMDKMKHDHAEEMQRLQAQV